MALVPLLGAGKGRARPAANASSRQSEPVDGDTGKQGSKKAECDRETYLALAEQTPLRDRSLDDERGENQSDPGAPNDEDATHRDERNSCRQTVRHALGAGRL